LGDTQGQSQTLIALADLAAGETEPGEAAVHYVRALRLAHQSGHLRETVLAMEGLAGRMNGRDLARGVRLAAAADEMRRAAGGVPWPNERARLEAWREVARRQLGPRRFALADAEGRVMPVADAIQLGVNGRWAQQ
jgi:hypothetical protein